MLEYYTIIEPIDYSKIPPDYARLIGPTDNGETSTFIMRLEAIIR